MTKYTIRFISHKGEEAAIEQISKGIYLADRLMSKESIIGNSSAWGTSKKGIISGKKNAQRTVERLEAAWNRSVGYLTSKGETAYWVGFEIVKA